MATQDGKIPVQCLFFKTKKGCKHKEKCAYLHDPKKEPKSNESVSTSIPRKNASWENYFQHKKMAFRDHALFFSDKEIAASSTNRKTKEAKSNMTTAKEETGSKAAVSGEFIFQYLATRANLSRQDPSNKYI